MKHYPSVKQLQYLCALKEKGSFSAAADACYVTQSTLSAGIAALEDTLGQAVVDRSSRKLIMTPYGETILQNIQTIIEELDKILYQAEYQRSPMSGPMRLGIIPTIAPYVLPKIFPALSEKFPALELQIHEDLTHNLIRKLEGGQIDVALIAFPYPTKGLSNLKLGEEAFVAAVPDTDIWKKKKCLTLGDIQDNQLLVLEDGHCLRDHVESACQITTSPRDQVFSISNIDTLLMMVGHGYGITLLPTMAADNLKAVKNIRLIPIHKNIPGREIGLCWRPHNPLSKNFEILGHELEGIIF